MKSAGTDPKDVRMAMHPSSAASSFCISITHCDFFSCSISNSFSTFAEETSLEPPLLLVLMSLPFKCLQRRPSTSLSANARSIPEELLIDIEVSIMFIFRTAIHSLLCIRACVYVRTSLYVRPHKVKAPCP